MQTPLNGNGVNGIHECEVGRLKIGDRKVGNEIHDCRRKNELITSCRVLIDSIRESIKCEGKSIEISSMKDNKN